MLKTDELSSDWYGVFRGVTQFRYIEKDALQAHPKFGLRMLGNPRSPIATIREIKDAKIAIHKNLRRFGIPQGTPISSALSNLYMIDLDKVVRDACAKSGTLYQRYSDDILFICSPDSELDIISVFAKAVKDHKLTLNIDKIERAEFDGAVARRIQYLGYDISDSGATIRASSLSRQWRKAKMSIRKIRKIGESEIAYGRASKIYTSSLRRRFQSVGVRNFSDYARRSAAAFASPHILRQIRRFERMVAAALRSLNP